MPHSPRGRCVIRQGDRFTKVILLSRLPLHFTLSSPSFACSSVKRSLASLPRRCSFGSSLNLSSPFVGIGEERLRDKPKDLLLGRRVSMGCRHLWSTANILAFLRLTANCSPLRLPDISKKKSTTFKVQN